jgi:type IV pilus assembly protein PilX
MQRKSLPQGSSFKQQGAVLIVGLVMLLLMTVVGLAAVRGSGLQEAMAGNMRDRNLSFQAAEAGLRAAEAELDPTSAFSGANGHFPDLGKTGSTLGMAKTWDKSTWESQGQVASIDLSAVVPSGPRYVIERLVMPIGMVAAGDGSGFDVGSMSAVPEPEYYRISSRSTGGTTDSATVLQTVFKRMN